jgi:hypothetical protein
MSEFHDIRESTQYYNVTIPGNSPPSTGNNPMPTIATFSEVRTTPLLNGFAEDYFMSVVRFTVPTSFIPLFIAPIVPFPNPDPNLMVHTVTLSYLGNYFQRNLIFVPQVQPDFVPVPPRPAGPIYDPSNPTQIITPAEGIIRNNYVSYYGLYSYQHFLDILNDALSRAWGDATGLNIVFPGVVPFPPFMTYDAPTQLFTLHTPVQYASNAVNPVKIYFSYFLIGLFQASFNTLVYGFNQPFGADVSFVIEDLNVNHEEFTFDTPLPTVYQYYFFTQEANTIAQFSPLNSIVFLSGNLPIRTEWVSYANTAEYTPQSNTTTSLNNNFLRIVTDFEVDITNANEIHSYIRYVPTAQYRYIDLIGKGSIEVIDIQVFWRDNFGNLYPLLIPFGQNVTIKILFEKKRNIKKLLTYDSRY